jgi:NADPH-dependent ferric siderophore reductase
VAVRRVEPVGARLTRLTLAGDELAGFPPPEPAASVRVLFPTPPHADLVLPEWNGNEFLLPDGSRPAIRTLTPVRFDPATRELDVDIVFHGAGAASTWAREAAHPGTETAVSGPGRGYAVVTDAPAYLLGGDETALPAIRQLLGVIPGTIPTAVHVEVSRPDGRIALPDHAAATITWHDLPAGAAPGDALVGAIADAEVVPGGRVWVAGEAAAVQRIRRHLFETRGVARPLTTIRGYWKHGRSGAAVDEGS